MNSTDDAISPNPAGESPTERVAALAGETPVGEGLTLCPGGCGFTVIPDSSLACGCGLDAKAPPPAPIPQSLDQFTAWELTQKALHDVYEELHRAWVAERLSDSQAKSRRLGEAYRLVTSRLPEAVTKLRRSLGTPSPKEGK